MSPLSAVRRRAPWISGALLLGLIVLPLVGAALRVGLRYWPFFVGAAALLVLAAGSFERWWQSRPLVHPRPHTGRRGRFRVLEGGRREAGPTDLRQDEKDDEPRWLM